MGLPKYQFVIRCSLRHIASQVCLTPPPSVSYKRLFIAIPRLPQCPLHVHLFSISGPSSAVNPRNPFPLSSELLCTGGACHPPKHVHFQAFATPFHFMAGLEVYRRIGFCSALGTVVRTSKRRHSRFLEFSLRGALFLKDDVPCWIFAETRVQDAIFGITLRSIEWTFIKSPLRRREPTKRNQDDPIERRLSASTVFLDAFELLCNIRGVGWSWSSNSFPGESMPSSIAVLFAKTLLKLTVFDASQYIIQYVFPSVNSPKGGSIFDPSLPFVPRTALAAFSGICGGVWSYTFVDTVYHVSALVGRTVFRQPASVWPRAFNRPWMSTSIQEFWGFRWHQFMRHHFIMFGARPGGTLFGKPGAVMGAFALSAILHHIGLWGSGNGTEFITAGGFFLLMGIGVIIEGGFRSVTGLRVQGWLGWSWTMLWTTLWGTFIIDGWA